MRPSRALVLLLPLLFVLLAPVTASADSYGDIKNAKYIWKTATLAPKGIGYSLLFEEILLPEVKKHTKDELYLKIYWGGIMGDDKQVLKKMKINQLQGAGLSGQGTFLISPDIPVLGLPFLFNDYDEVDYLKCKMIDRFDEITQTQDLKVLLWLDQDFDQIYASKYPVNKVEDFSRQQFCTWFGALEGKLIERLGGTAIPMDVTEIPSSMRSGIADAMIAPSIWIVGTQLYTTFRYVNPLKIRYVPAFNVVTKKAWSEVPLEFQAKLADIRLDVAQRFNDRSRVDAQKCLKAMVKYGVKEATTTPEQLVAIKAKSLPLWDELAGPLYSKQILDEVKATINEYRELKKAGKAPDIKELIKQSSGN